MSSQVEAHSNFTELVEMAYLKKLDNENRLSIPAVILRQLGIEKGEAVHVSFKEGLLTISKYIPEASAS